MKWSRNEIVGTNNGNISFSEDVTIDPQEFANTSLINGVKQVHAEGKGYLDQETEKFYSSMTVSGIMLCPDAITGEEIEYPFETDVEDVWSFDPTDEEDVRAVTDDVIDLLPAVIDAVIMEAPLQVTEAAPEDYPSGEGWRVISEEEYQRSKEEEIDPRLAVLKKFRQE